MNQQSAVKRLDRMFPFDIQKTGAYGLGHFIRIILDGPAPAETKAEIIAVAVIKAFDLIEEADTI